jgi:hypothetical protein
MKRVVFGSLMGALLLIGLVGAASAQSKIEINGHVGGLALDDVLTSETELLIGARATYHLPGGLSVGGNFDWSQITFGEGVGIDEAALDVDLYLYSIEVDYNFPTAGQTGLFVGAGVGGATFSPAEDAIDSDTQIVVPLTVGIKWANRPSDANWGVRAEFRDNIIVLSDVLGVEGFDDTTHNFEFSGGFSYFIQ